MTTKPKRTTIVLRSRNLPDEPKPEATALSDMALRLIRRNIKGGRLFSSAEARQLVDEVDRLRAENAALLEQIRSVIDIHDEVSRLRAENASLQKSAEEMFERSDAEQMRLRAENARQAETIAKLEAQLESNAEEADGFYAEGGKAKCRLEQLQNRVRKLVSACKTAERVLGVAASFHSENSVYAAARDEVNEALKGSQ